MSTALFPSQVPAASTAVTVGPLLPCPADDVACTTTTAQLRIDPAANVVPPGTGTQPPSPKAEVLQAWPRSAQWATAFLLGLAVALMAVYSLGYLRSGSRPMELERGVALTYRVDLNKAELAELLQLPGIGPNKAQAILRNKGRFHSVEDLAQIHGFGPATLEQLRPWISVTPIEDTSPIAVERRPQHAEPRNKVVTTKNKKGAGLTTRIDINNASVEELRKLPGIGPKMSQRIVDAREKAKFQTVDELRRVPGIGPKTLERLRPYVTVHKAPARIATAE